jgi:hypothetical protein
MQIRDIESDIAVQLPADFRDIVLPEIDYCDQSEAPPTKAIQTHALFFMFLHTPPGHNHQHAYKGLLIYSPPLYSLSLGNFSGTGALVGRPETGTPQEPSPWVRIAIAMRRSAVVDPETLEHRVDIGGGFSFCEDVAGLPGPPGEVKRYVAGDIDLHSPGPPKAGSRLPSMELTNVPEGDRGTITWTRTTVVL